ncbi:hypothetical protein [Pseudomonas sp.]|uniref:hypothetical protein n=1 Tax=Pseudomonas sp. TaxID=306 RepID=UPI003FD6ED8E
MTYRVGLIRAERPTSLPGISNLANLCMLKDAPLASAGHVLDMQVPAPDDECQQRPAVDSVSSQDLPLIEIN